MPSCQAWVTWLGFHTHVFQKQASKPVVMIMLTCTRLLQLCRLIPVHHRICNKTQTLYLEDRLLNFVRPADMTHPHKCTFMSFDTRLDNVRGEHNEISVVSPTSK